MLVGVDRTEQLLLDAEPAAVLAVVEDLSTYPRWLDLVRLAEPVHGADVPSWDVELRATVGPFARSKRLHMVRARHEVTGGGGVVRFERREPEGRRHSPWVLTALVEPGEASGTALTMRLHYGGSLWGPVLDRVLADAVERGRSTLPGVVAGGPASAG